MFSPCNVGCIRDLVILQKYSLVSVIVCRETHGNQLKRDFNTQKKRGAHNKNLCSEQKSGLVVLYLLKKTGEWQCTEVREIMFFGKTWEWEYTEEKQSNIIKKGEEFRGTLASRRSFSRKHLHHYSTSPQHYRRENWI